MLIEVSRSASKQLECCAAVDLRMSTDRYTRKVRKLAGLLTRARGSRARRLLPQLIEAAVMATYCEAVGKHLESLDAGRRAQMLYSREIETDVTPVIAMVLGQSTLDRLLAESRTEVATRFRAKS